MNKSGLIALVKSGLINAGFWTAILTPSVYFIKDVFRWDLIGFWLLFFFVTGVIRTYLKLRGKQKN